MGMIQTAEYALVIRDLCRQFFAERHSHLMFRIGLDHGPAIGSIIGSSQQSYNLCGEAVRMATTMADTSLQGSIQATESVYRVLRDHYLFQVRGAHYLENVGVLTTYIMSGRL
jgi:class 3 adenylate cyclase